MLCPQERRRSAYRVLIGEPERMRQLVITGYRLENNKNES
jgi:hypothetical protein